MDMNRLLEGKRVCITTGSRGIGKAIAMLFAKHGAVIAVGGRREEPLNQALREILIYSPDSKAYLVDLSKGEETEQFCISILKDFNGIDILVNTVGVNCRKKPHELSDIDVSLILETNYMSAFRCERAFLPGMIERGYGNIICISSIHSITTMPGYYIYAGSKGAINASARTTALDYAENGIRVNTICPGLILSDSVKDEINAYAEGPERDNFLELLNRMQPLPPGKSEDVAFAALYFASDLSSYITGQTLIVDGGASIKAHP
jgi:NAD(P)-dependent dehydrogenase (short-subunit alcohol dehydrogenase family)